MLTKKQDKLFSSSLGEAEQSTMAFRHGCIATYGGHIIASGYNTSKNYSSRDIFIQESQCSCHAEMNVLRKIYYKNREKKHKRNRIMRRLTLYISRYSKSGSSTNSAPCNKCLNIIKHFGVRKMIFHMDHDYYEYKPQEYQTTHETWGEMMSRDRIHNLNQN